MEQHLCQQYLTPASHILDNDKLAGGDGTRRLITTQRQFSQEIYNLEIPPAPSQTISGSIALADNNKAPIENISVEKAAPSTLLSQVPALVSSQNIPCRHQLELRTRFRSWDEGHDRTVFNCKETLEFIYS